MRWVHGIFLFLLLFFVSVDNVFADTGYIDTSATNQAKVCHNASCDDFGIINFELDAETSIVVDSDDGITGNVWGDELGWINFAPTGSGVEFADNKTGLLTGYAWSQVSGWINFAPTGQSVVVNPETGEFQGYAWSGGAYGGWIKFDCSDSTTCVRTTWRPDLDGGGGGSVVSTGTDDDEGEVSVPSIESEPDGDPPLPPVEPELELDPEPEPDVPNVLPNPSVFIPELDFEGPILGVLKLTEFFLNLGEELFKFLLTPIGNILAKIITAVGLTVALLGALFTNVWSLADLGLQILRLWLLFLYGVGFKKRNRPWGTVYDSVTKQPLDPVYVVLNNSKGEEVATSITDLDGRYGFLVEPGQYRIVANKTNYIFPSQKLLGKQNDELYNDLYFGEDLKISEDSEVITKNIPLDRLNFDWNEFAKLEQGKMRFYKARDIFLSRVSNLLFFLGFMLSIVMLFVLPSPYNLIVFLIYLVFFVFRNLKINRQRKGSVILDIDDIPLSYGILRIKSATNGQEIAHSVLDRFGNYYLIVPNGIYVVNIEKKNEDGTYSLVYTSSSVEVKNGILRKNFRIAI